MAQRLVRCDGIESVTKAGDRYGLALKESLGPSHTENEISKTYIAQTKDRIRD